MANNCLVKNLKGTVSNSSLSFYNAARVRLFNTSGLTNTNSVVGINGYNGSLKIRVIEGSINVYHENTDFVPVATGVTGEDVKGDGNVYFMGASAISATVDYINGTMAVVGTIAANDVSGAVARVDMGAEEDGANTLKLVPRRTNWTVTAVQHAVQLQNNIESISYIDKQILGKNFGEVATRQMLDAFIYTLNDEVVRKSIDQAKKNISDAALVTDGAYLDLSTYYAGITSTTSAFQNFSTTKNEMI